MRAKALPTDAEYHKETPTRKRARRIIIIVPAALIVRPDKGHPKMSKMVPGGAGQRS